MYRDSGRLAGSLRAAGAAVRRWLVRPTGARIWWREVVLVGILYGAYEVSRGIGSVDIDVALSHGRAILHLERVWHVAPERLLNELLEHVEILAVAASYFYSAMHYLVTPIVLVWMFRSHREGYGFARTALALSTAIGLVGYLLVPTAPPRLVHGSGLHDILAMTQGDGWWSNDGSVPRGLGGLTNQFAAMPSLHVGWALWCGVLIARYASRRWVRVLGISYPIVTTLVVMGTGNHYLLDAIAGGVTMAIGALLAAGLPKRFTSVPMSPASVAVEGIGHPRNGRIERPRPAPRAIVTTHRLPAALEMGADSDAEPESEYSRAPS